MHEEAFIRVRIGHQPKTLNAVIEYTPKTQLVNLSYGLWNNATKEVDSVHIYVSPSELIQLSKWVEQKINAHSDQSAPIAIPD